MLAGMLESLPARNRRKQSINSELEQFHAVVYMLYT